MWLLRKHRNKFPDVLIYEHQDVDDEFILECYHNSTLSNHSVLYKGKTHRLPEVIIRELESEINWSMLSTCKIIPSDLLMKYSDEINPIMVAMSLFKEYSSVVQKMIKFKSKFNYIL